MNTKILAVVNTHQPNDSLIKFACRIASLTNSPLTGLFVGNDTNSHTRPVTSGSYFSAYPQQEAPVAVRMDSDQAVRLFQDCCAWLHQACETIVKTGPPAQIVLDESRFADLLVVDPKMNDKTPEDEWPSPLVEAIMASAACPVVLAPLHFSTIEELVLCNDGSASALYAIKQFTYLFPQFRNKDVVLLEVSNHEQAGAKDDHRRLVHWLQLHYPVVTSQVLDGPAKEALFTYLFKKEKKFVVMGAYGRSSLSKFFRESTAAPLIRAIDLPYFITHKPTL